MDSGLARFTRAPERRRKEKAAVAWATAAPITQSLLAEADAVDRAGPVVGHQHRAVLGEHDVGGTAEIALVALDPAGGKDFLLGVLAVGTDDNALDPRALVLMPIPGAVLG